MQPAYFDHNATTPVDEAVLAAMLPFFSIHFGNASSRHEFGRTARKAVDEARERVADAVGAHPSQVIFVSGGTEANNLFVKGAAANLKPSQIAVSAVEHPCVAKPAQELQQLGWRLRKLAVADDGRLVMADLEEALKAETGIVSVMLANNETGVLQDVPLAAGKARSRGALVHTDAVQALGKVAVDFAQLQVHALSISSHKIYGPKGAGALVVDKSIELAPQLAGGGHEWGLRSGTENVPAIVGFGMACELAVARLHETAQRLKQMRDRLEDGLRGMGAVLFGATAERIPNTSFFAFPGIEGETLVMAMDRAGFALASGSACSSDSVEPSPVLLAMGVVPEVARGAMRASLGRGSTMAQVEDFLRMLGNELGRLQRLSAVAV